MEYCIERMKEKNCDQCKHQYRKYLIRFKFCFCGFFLSTDLISFLDIKLLSFPASCVGYFKL